MARPVARGSVETTVTYLEMTAPPADLAAPPAPAGVTIESLRHPSPATYRPLYERAGRDWTWTARTLMSDEALAAIIEDARVEIFVLSVDGRPAGYVELDGRNAPDLELGYLGIFPEYLGRRLGGWLLRWAIAYGWRERSPSRMWVHTCALDHPAALPLYRKAGFREFAVRKESVDLI
jgi:GNAT superfamily N-acetyltransferase